MYVSIWHAKAEDNESLFNVTFAQYRTSVLLLINTHYIQLLATINDVYKIRFIGFNWWISVGSIKSNDILE